MPLCILEITAIFTERETFFFSMETRVLQAEGREAASDGRESAAIWKPNKELGQRLSRHPTARSPGVCVFGPVATV